jgi:hypothetical protein
MNKYRFLSTAFVSSILFIGCTKPDSVTIIKSPTSGVFYTVEVSKASGPTSDTTRVYAHLDRAGKVRKILVLEGSDLTVTQIVWNNPHDATLCLAGGITDIFRNEVTLIVGDSTEDSERLYNHLGEHC